MKICNRSHRYDPNLPQCPDCIKINRVKFEERNKEKLRAYYKEYDHLRSEKRKVQRTAGSEYSARQSVLRKARYRRDPTRMLETARKSRMKNPERTIWSGIINRCTNSMNRGFKNYGGRGITICDRWTDEDGYRNFLLDVGRRPTPKHSIERRNNNEGYGPDNCYWATRGEQSRNTRRTRVFEFNGKKQCMQDWANDLGITASLLWSRINFLKWPLERALTTGPANPWTQRSIRKD